MRPATALIALAMAPAACGSVDAPQPAPITLGQPFTLAIGGMAALIQPPVRVGLDSVVSDSRCPLGEQCIVAGRGVLRVWTEQGRQPRRWHELSTSGDSPPPRLEGLVLKLIELAPPRVSGRALAAADYRATLVLSVDDSDR